MTISAPPEPAIRLARKNNLSEAKIDRFNEVKIRLSQRRLCNVGFSTESLHNHYDHAIMVKALADRLAEAGAEWLHQRMRCERGLQTAPLSNAELIHEKYRGIRPAFGYPACPDHTPKRRLFELLDAPAAGLTLTETCAMLPAASVSGMVFHHPQATYFNVGHVDRDQVAEYAQRSGFEVKEMEKWLGPNLAYDPSAPT